MDTAINECGSPSGAKKLCCQITSNFEGRSSPGVPDNNRDLDWFVEKKRVIHQSDVNPSALLNTHSAFGQFDAFLRSFSSTDGCVSRFLCFLPLQTSIVGVFDEVKQCQGRQDEGSPLKRREGEYLEFLAFLFFVVGFWFIYTAFGVEQKTIISISKILIGVIVLTLGWATEQAALNLIDFGRIDWSHLL